MKAAVGKPDFASVLKVLPEETQKVISSLSPEDLEILAYLIVCPSEARSNTEHSSNNNRSGNNPRPQSKSRVSIHICPDAPKRSSSSAAPSSPVLTTALQSRQPALFDCSCFQCYTSYWGRWGASPNHGIIDEAISLYEDHISKKPLSHKKKKYEKGEKKKNEGKGKGQRGGPQDKLRKHEESAAAAAGTDVNSNNICSMPLVSNSAGESMASESIAGESSPPKLSSPTKKAKGAKDHRHRSSGKEKQVPKGKSSRIAPFVEDGIVGNNREDSVAISCVVEEAFILGEKRFWSLLANRFWGFFS